MKELINILIVDDHRMFLEGITSLINKDSQLNVVKCAQNVKEAISYLSVNPEVDVVITDVSMPELSGTELCKTLSTEYPETGILVLTMHEDIATVKELLNAGATGYILKNTGHGELIEAIKAVAQSQTYFSNEVKDNIMADMIRAKRKTTFKNNRLSKRELEIIKLIAEENTTTEIADKLFISLHTVESHRKNILRKTGSRNLAGLIRYAVKEGLVD